GISLSGAGLGAVVVSPLAAYLIQSLDWRTAYLIIGVLAWVVVLPLSRLVVNRTGNTDAAPAGSAAAMVPDLPFSKLLRSRNFILLWLNFMLFGTCLFLVYTHLVPHATDTGISGEQAATIMSVLGFASVAGRILLGIVADRFGRKLMAVSCTVLQGVSLLFLIWADGLWAFYLFALVFGFGLGGVGPTTAALVGDTFGLRKIGVILGALDVGFGVGAALGPVAAGFIFDVSHSYAVAFITGTLAAFAGALVLWLVKKDIS
ncbi:MAG: MFS transporter, partial [Dehalococcoidales bacterium]|nr:MFS transporter [Dehalococcoidales bacterium]